MNELASSAKATRREWIGLAIIALPCLVYAMDLTVLNLAIPIISEELKPSGAQLLWIIDIYGFLVAGFLITMGTLGDRIGRKKLLLIGGAIFCVASIIAAFSNSAEMLILMRALLGVAGATMAPSTMSLIRNMFHDERERQFAISVWIASFSFGGAIGPLVGGVVLEFFSWGAVFLVAVPVMLALLILGPKLLPEYRDPNAGSIDFLSVIFSLGAILAGIYGLKSMAEYGVAISSLMSILLGLMLGFFFVKRQAILSYPLLDLKLFRISRFTAAITAYGLSCLAMVGVYIHVSQFLQLVLNLSPLHAGLATAPWSLAFVVGSLMAPKLASRYQAVSIMVWGLIFAAMGFLIMMLIDFPFTLTALVVGMVVMGLGMAPVFTIGNEMIITSAPPERAGAASAISETCAEFCGALGIAIFGSISMVLYRTKLNAFMPEGIPEALRNESIATLGGAVASAKALSPPLNQNLLDVAGRAFGDGLQLISFIGAVIVIVAGILMGKMLRGESIRN